jgi:hypothetical protein
MKASLWLSLILIGVFKTISLAHADSVLTCDEVKQQQGVAAWLTCVANQTVKNYTPGGGPGPGMTMDTMGSAIDKTLCQGQGGDDHGLCDGHQAGDVVGSCTCK